MRSYAAGAIASAIVIGIAVTAAMAQQRRPAPPVQPGAPAQPAAKKAAPPAAAQKGFTAAASDRARDADDKAIRANVDAFVKAYNAHDAKTIANMFTAEGELVDEEGDIERGRDQIAGVFSAVFEEFPSATMSVTIGEIRFLAPSLAVEDGVALVVHDAKEPAERNRYSVTHVKQDGRWLMASARDLPDQPNAADELKQLEWLIGDWVDESSTSVVSTSTRWTDDHAFILSDFTIHVAGRPVMTGTQRIGWDPLSKVFRCWVFDSQGGFGSGIYSHDGDQWTVKMTSVTFDGQPASATNTITKVSKDRMTWQSHDRMIGGRPLPDVDAIVVVKKPPEAK